MNAHEVRLLVGHVLDQLRPLPPASVHCVITSPPYWGLRDYSRCGCAMKAVGSGLRTSEWDGSVRGDSTGSTAPDPRGIKEPDPNCPKCHGTGKDDSLTVMWDAVDVCEHEWGADVPGDARGGSGTPTDKNNRGESYARAEPKGAFCLKCNAWRGQLGLEPTPDLYVQHIVQVFREVRRVLRDDGTLWLNMGDCYAVTHQGRAGNQHSESFHSTGQAYRENVAVRREKGIAPGLKPKDLVGIPWRVAFALQADGWWLRSDIIWSKLNPMPESVTDRPTKAHEYVFLLAKSANYFFDADAVREGISPASIKRWKGDLIPHNPAHGSSEQSVRGEQSLGTPMGGRNIRTVWTIPTQPYKDAHFATFPSALVEPCIKAGTSEKGVCATCGAPWERVVEKFIPTDIGRSDASKLKNNDGSLSERAHLTAQRRLGQAYQDQLNANPPKTIGFRPTCDHATDPIPATVLDPFAGSGTVGEVARGLGRSAILIEIKEEYAALAALRGNLAQPALDTFAEGA